MTIQDNLNELENKLNTVKGTIVTNLTEKGVSSVTTASTLTEMANSITEISAGGGGDVDFAALGIEIIPSFWEEEYKDGYKYAIEIKDNWDVNQTDLSYKFVYDNKLVIFPLVDMTKVLDIRGIFKSCENLHKLSRLDAPLCTKANDAFYGCDLESIGNINLPLVTDLRINLFGQKSYLTTVGDINISSNPTARGMFEQCKKLKTVGNIDITNSTNTYNMFSYCESLTHISSIKNSNTINMGGMFSSCNSLTYIPQIDTSKATNLSSMFSSCNSLTYIPQIDTSKATNLSLMFWDCSVLTELPILDFSSATDMDDMFAYSYKLVYILIKNLGKAELITNAPSFSPCLNWGVNSDKYPYALNAMKDSLIKYSFDRATAGYAPLSIELSSTTKGLLDENDIAAITAKGFTIA